VTGTWCKDSALADDAAERARKALQSEVWADIVRHVVDRK